MIVTCEECGKKYQIYPDRIQEEEPRFQCKNCRNWIFVPEELVQSADSLPVDFPSEDDVGTEDDIFGEAFTTLADFGGEESPKSLMPDLDDDDTPLTDFPSEDTFGAIPGDTGSAIVMETVAPPRGGRRIGILGKMLFLFLFLPIVFVTGAGTIYTWQVNRLTSLITTESADLVAKMSENIISDTANAVAGQVKIYLKTHPELAREDFNTNPEFKKIALQKVGRTGYTALYERPRAKGDVWRTWVHTNPGIIGIDMTTLRNPMGKNFPGFWKIYSGVLSGRQSNGYYKWHESDGSVRDKYMSCVPVTGTRFVVAATTYIEEFTKDVNELKENADNAAKTTQRTTITIFMATILVLFLCVFIYAKGFAAKIRNLTSLTERISVGELDAELEVRSNDEIGDLGEAINRMQESIRHSISRLRKRK